MSVGEDLMTLIILHVKVGVFFTKLLVVRLLRCKYTSENFPRNGKFSAERMRSMIFSLEKIVLRMWSEENFPFRGKFSEVYMHLYINFY